MTLLVNGSPWTALLVTLVVCGALAAGFRIVLHRHLGVDLSAAAPIASPLMPALGAVFALLAATTIGAEAAQFRSAGDDVSAEAAAASRLAWASTTPGVDSDAILDELAVYLRATRATEWRDGDRDGSPRTAAALTKLERTVRAASVSKTLGSAQAGELLSSLDALTSLRRQRLAHATNEMPDGYLLVVLASGLALVANSSALAVAQRRRVAMLTAGLVVVVSLTLALLVAISSPFDGGFVVGGGPIDAVRANVESGMFHR